MSARIFRDLLIGVMATSATALVVLGAFSLGLAETMVRATATPTPPPTVTPQTPNFLTVNKESSPATPTISIEPTTTKEVCPPPHGWVLTNIDNGDTIESLSGAYAVSPQEIKEKNCLVGDSPPSVGSLYLPAQFAALTRTPTPPVTTVQCGPAWGWMRYIVLKGDNLFRLSLAYGVSVPQLQFANCLGSSTLIRAGQVLYVPNVPTRTPSATFTQKPDPTATPTDKPPQPPAEPSEEPPNGSNGEGANGESERNNG